MYHIIINPAAGHGKAPECKYIQAGAQADEQSLRKMSFRSWTDFG
jgi:hypothetical protein